MTCSLDDMVDCVITLALLTLSRSPFRNSKMAHFVIFPPFPAVIFPPSFSRLFPNIFPVYLPYAS